MSATFCKIKWSRFLCGLSGGACIKQCPQQTFSNSTGWRCQPCHRSCQTCHGPRSTDCNLCLNGNAPLHGQCPMVNCPLGQYYDGMRKKKICVRASSLECKVLQYIQTGQHFLRKNTLIAGFSPCGWNLPLKRLYRLCSPVMYSGYSALIAGKNSLCHSCDASCKTCFGPQALDCSSCFKGANIFYLDFIYLKLFTVY